MRRDRGKRGRVTGGKSERAMFKTDENIALMRQPPASVGVKPLEITAGNPE